MGSRSSIEIMQVQQDYASCRSIPYLVSGLRKPHVRYKPWLTELNTGLQVPNSSATNYMLCWAQAGSQNAVHLTDLRAAAPAADPGRPETSTK